jgi:serine/threonine protein kinase
VVGSDADGTPYPGDVIAGKYSVVRELGKGGMGVVLEAQHLKLGHRVAIKLLHPSFRSMSDITARFEREARAIARLKGPHVTKVSDVDALPDGSPFMVMELLKGYELGDELDKRNKLPYREAVGYVLQACAAMAEAHREGIVHRDLKPSNLFLSDTGQGRTVKVLDFGISKLAGDINASVTTTASAFGTPLYMSPEQVRSVKNVDPRADIWSLGVVLYELISGEVPFNGPSATAILASILTEKPIPLVKRCPDVPKSLSDAVMRALEKNAANRYHDIVEFAAAIAPYGPPRDHPSLSAIAVELQNAPTRRGSRPGQKPLLIAVGALVMLGAFGGVIAATNSTSVPPVVPSTEPVVASSTPAPQIALSGPVEPPPTAAAPSAPSSNVPAGTARKTLGSVAPLSTSSPRLTSPAPAPAPKPGSSRDPKYL